jgi:signal transduction histidine kinase
MHSSPRRHTLKMTLLLGVLIALLSALLVPAFAITPIEHAEVVVQPARSGEALAPATIRMPFNWDSTEGGNDGKATVVLRFSVDDPSAPQGIFFARIGNAYEARLNGALLGAKGSGDDPYEDYSKQPQLFNIPAGVLKKDNELTLLVHAQGGRRAGVSTPVIGPLQEVTELYEDSYRWRVSGFLALSIVSAVLGILALLLWMRQREPLYLYYGVGEILWAVLVSDTLTERTLLPWPYWGVVVFSAYALAAALISKFSLIFVDRHRGWMKTFGDWHLWATIPVVAATLLLRIPAALSAWLGLTLVVCIATAIIAVIEGMKSKELEKRVLALAVIATCIAATRDMFVFRIFPGFGGVPWVRYAWVAFGVTLAWTIAERMRKSAHAISMMNHELARRLAEREAELAATYSAKAEVLRNQAIIDERQRLTRDMHDGLGSQLLGALHLSQNAGVAREVVTAQLREALDHLKLTVDAMQDIEGDIASLLGALRYRLGERLDAAGVKLTWSVDPLPVVGAWTLQQSRDLQMILFEAFSNLVVHSGASTAHLQAEHLPGQDLIRIDLRDNGSGFGQPAAVRQGGHGLSNMHARSARLGARLAIDSTASGTRVLLELPLTATRT